DYLVFYRKVLRLFSYHGYSRMNRIEDTLLNPWHRLLRNSSYNKANLVSAVDVVKYWQGVFEANNIPEAQTSSEYIVSHVLGSKTFQNLNASSISAPLSAKQQKEIQQLCAKRLQRMPVQYVLGEWDFQDLTLKMKPPVFIPRPETEPHFLVHWLLRAVSYLHCKSRGPVILEVGCGSGAIGLSLLKKLPYVSDISLDNFFSYHSIVSNSQRLPGQVPAFFLARFFRSSLPLSPSYS
uniref:Release factor glutamine methyltransferase N-terminal domain-containing protein n=1 Tax=Laticauda laticaudata TaxID=8630 RepID=A0A8C5RGU8_LATLA